MPVRAAMVANVGAAAGLPAEIGMIAGRVAMGLRVPVVGAMTSAGRVLVVRRKAGAMNVAAAAIVAEAGAISSSSGIVIASQRRRSCGRRK